MTIEHARLDDMKRLLTLFVLLAGVANAQDVKNSAEGMIGAYGAVISRIG